VTVPASPRLAPIHAVGRWEDCPPLPPDSVAVVFDVLRASTAMTAAAAAGVRRILPVAEVEEARALAAVCPVPLAGERDNQPIAGFQYGNSPRDWDNGVVAREVVWTTTNGTRALARVRDARVVLVGALTNRRAVAARLATLTEPIWLIAAGSRGAFALEDWLAVGAVAAALDPRRWTDAARAAVWAYRQWADDLETALFACHHARELLALGLEADVRAAAALDHVAWVLEADPPDHDGRRWLTAHHVSSPSLPHR
jgi:2-phosphosulfolactate phosphatase